MTADERVTLIRVKVERAKKHLGDLEAARNRFFKPDPYVIERNHDPETGDDVSKVTNIRTPPVEIGLIAGDAIHNLRSALDHLAYNLVLVETKMKPASSVYYPIFADAKSYESGKTGKVKGMSEEAKDAIDASKPYGGGTDELYWLHTLDITDKHHALFVTLVCATGVLMRVPARWWKPDYNPRFKFHNLRTPLKDGDVILTCEPGFEDYVNFAFDVAFAEPKVVEGKAFWHKPKPHAHTSALLAMARGLLTKSARLAKASLARKLSRVGAAALDIPRLAGKPA